ncbi:MAG: hypothetical protein A3G32_05810 [Deltaproteobacteria bacterium RIFCSPLOWO2_12_FULL_40_28]|nr:MAG: hypothetical protein A3C45_03980 [Deltaproteobacteria bacterium RIFCSPHIGHO2_02_FULL_40_28]OGQ18979.1 MAG: hypothetical protein A3E27_09810 [Deltaproteobacteria bacterium RIFCSPHIGHO2_12_FULL_40_32]OGQ39522.1 MAG: hypothetical protein A3I69_09925 [Deltaproteobacteria bacterium RIFCSPLOWO2_02_FULL_40_36]OGQ53412.1 MAG: hypothetical protein A3G32_05810 [Deltaproteobacteria bacterium RIFCSPLOWO2_12_FULL_40_28]
MRLFPFDHEVKKPLKFFPKSSKDLTGDILEIGPGRGGLLFYLASLQPHKKFIAIELGKSRFLKLSENIQKKKLENITLIGGDARIVVPQYFSENTFEIIYVLFPDPWPKGRHAFRRLLSKEFVWLLSHVLKPEGKLIIGTDVQSYAKKTQTLLREVHWLKPTHDGFLPNLPELPETFFEKKWKSMGRKNYFLKLMKKFNF